MTEAPKERIYREALEEISDLVIDVAMNFDETGVDSVDGGKLMDIVNKALSGERNQQPGSSDKLSVEKLQEQLNTAKKALTEIAYGEYDTFKLSAVPIAKQALAALEGGEDESLDN